MPALLVPEPIALELLRRHESYHYKFDVATLAFEGVSRRAFYEPQKRAFRKCPEHQPEEALANQNVWEWAKRKDPSRHPMRGPISLSGIAQFAYDFMMLQPGAYARFVEPNSALKREAAAGLFEGIRYRGAMPTGIDYGPWIGLAPSDLPPRFYLPEYIVRNVLLSSIISPAHWLPAVRAVRESAEVAMQLGKRYQSLQKQWAATKTKLVRATGAAGLDFKRWAPSPGLWSVRINDNFRAHLRPVDLKQGLWEVVEFGPHTALGHG